MRRILGGRWAGFEGQDFAANIDYGTMHLWVRFRPHRRHHRHWH